MKKIKKLKMIKGLKQGKSARKLIYANNIKNNTK